MAGLDPAIHDLNSEDVDARHKTGHDGSTLFPGNGGPFPVHGAADCRFPA